MMQEHQEYVLAVTKALNETPSPPDGMYLKVQLVADDKETSVLGEWSDEFEKWYFAKRVLLPRSIRENVRFKLSSEKGESAHWIWEGEYKDGKPHVCDGKGSRKSAVRWFFETYRGPLRKYERLVQLCKQENCIAPRHYEKTSHVSRGSDLEEEA